MPVSQFIELEYKAGWDKTISDLVIHGLEYAETILETVLPESVYNAYTHGHRDAAKVCISSAQLPITSDKMFPD